MEMTMERGRAPERTAALAGMLRVAGSLVYDEPRRESYEALAASGLFDELPEGLGDACLAQGFELLGNDLREHAGADDEDAHVAALQREWLRLFAGVGEPQAPSWSNYYLDPESRVLGPETLRVRALYARHGLQAERRGAEPDDQLGLMLRFLAALVEAGGAEGVRDARELLALHVLPWFPRWRYLGEKHAGSAFYRGAVEFAFGTVVLAASDLGFSYNETTRSFSQRKDMK